MATGQHPYSVVSVTCKCPHNEDNQILNWDRQACNTGNEYTTHMTGNVVKANKVGPNCLCAQKCFERERIENVNFFFCSFMQVKIGISNVLIYSHTHNIQQISEDMR
ncbi:unnamed protein product, partial [Meganyctiphanes norvegica]